MDWVQWYVVVYLGLMILAGLVVHGRERDDKYFDFRVTFMGLVLGLPYFGRIFGWW